MLNDLIIFTILYWIGRFYCWAIESCFKAKVNLSKGGYMVVGMFGIPLSFFIALLIFLTYKFFTDWIVSWAH